MKKLKVLFVIESLHAAGGEKSLVTLLNELDYDKLDVDLQLFVNDGEFKKYVPFQVNILPTLDYMKFLLGERSGSFSMWCSRLSFSVKSRIGNNRLHMTRARKWWISARNLIPVFDKEYDVAIAYSQCIPTFYVVEKIKASKKIGWVNCIFHIEGKERKWQQKFYEALDHIVLVSKAAQVHFERVFPLLKNKMLFIPDLISVNTISRMSKEVDFPYKDDVEVRLLTVARLDDKDKGYDISLKACKILKEKGLKFRWYALGRGKYKPTIEQFVRDNDLMDNFILLGTTPNPYPFYKHCTIYVQTSRHEGFGLSIAEARVLNRPIVTTEYDSVYNQMVPCKNGLVVPIDPEAVADAIMRLLEDKDLYDSIVNYQRQEKKDNLEELKNFYHVIGIDDEFI